MLIQKDISLRLPHVILITYNVTSLVIHTSMDKTIVSKRYLPIEILPIILVVRVQFAILFGNLLVEVLISDGLVLVIAKIIIDVI